MQRQDVLIAIALVEDNRVVREGLAALLGAVPGFSVVHAAASLDLAAIQKARANVLLLDMSLENGDSLEAARRFASELPEARIVVMDLLPAHEDIRDFVAAGVAGFVLKDASVDDLTETITAVASGANVLPSIAAGTLFTQIATAAATRRGAQVSLDIRLTAREREVVDLISEGLSNKAIAARLHISTHTVKSHVRNLMEKLTLHTRLQLASWVYHEDDAES
jgi:DNA-binding NarL/FixJ family response regulator